ncbi:MAG: 16S rRNA processing protein RimM [Syntrophaceae bacterium]|nr:16S rRNA processing protein RimM [Syntrophaceae bacterium]
MDLLVVGEIVKVRGLRGCVKVLTSMEMKNIVTGLKFVYLEDVLGKRKSHDIRELTASGKFVFLELKDITDRDSAQTLVGYKVLIPGDKLEELPQGEYYWRDIIGLDVYDDKGKYLGRIESIFPTGSNDVYVCRGEREILLPAIADVIRHIDIEKKIMTVRLLEGL